MIDWAGIITVFLFMLAIMSGASLSGWIFAKWESNETRDEINKGFEEIRRKLGKT